MTPTSTELNAAAPPSNPIADASSTKKAPLERFHQLDGLRAVACLIVVFHHSFGAIAKAFQSHGSPALKYVGDLLHATTGSGVELFFVLSGVVLLRPYVRSMRKFKPGTYFLRRAERLWPPFLVVLVLEGIVRVIAQRYPTWFTKESTFDLNVADWLKHLPIVNFGSPIWNMAWWSLSVEVLFYLTVPLVLPLFVWKRMNRTMLGILYVGLWAFAIYVLGGWNETSPTWYDSFQKLAIYSLCFATGIAIAKFDWRPREGWIFLGLGLLYLLSAIAFPRMNYHVGFALLYGGLVMLAFVPRSALEWFLSRHLMVWIGERSYSLFLIHFTMFFAANYLVSWVVDEKDLVYFIATRALGLPLALLGSMVLFHFVERRFARNLITAQEFWPPLVPRGPAERNERQAVSSI